MQPAILILHPQLRAAVPRALRSGFNGRFCARLKTTKAPRASKQESLLSKAKDSAPAGPRIPTTNPTTHAKTSIRKGTVHGMAWHGIYELELTSELHACRTTGTHIDLPWRNRADHIPGSAATDFHIPLWRIVPGCGASIRRGRISMVSSSCR